MLDSLGHSVGTSRLSLSMSPPSLSLSAHSEFSCRSTAGDNSLASWGAQPHRDSLVVSQASKRPRYESQACPCTSGSAALSPCEEPLESSSRDHQPAKRLRVSPGSDRSATPGEAQPNGEVQGPECVRVVVHNAPIPPRRARVPAIIVPVEHGEGAAWGLTSPPHEEEMELPPSPRRLNREMLACSRVPCIDVDGELDKRKIGEMRVEINKLLQPQKWKRVHEAICITREAKWNESCTGSRWPQIKGVSYMWPGRAQDNVPQKKASMQTMQQSATGYASSLPGRAVFLSMEGIGSKRRPAR